MPSPRDAYQAGKHDAVAEEREKARALGEAGRKLEPKIIAPNLAEWRQFLAALQQWEETSK